MSKITALRVGKGQRKRVNVSLDGRFAFSLEAEVAVKEGLQAGQELATGQLESLESFSPRSQWLTKRELRQKGVADNIIDQIADTIDDEDSAYRAALSKARSLPLADYQSFYRRLSDYLKRRGFGYGVIKHTVERLWPELGSKSGGQSTLTLKRQND